MFHQLMYVCVCVSVLCARKKPYHKGDGVELAGIKAGAEATVAYFSTNTLSKALYLSRGTNY